MSNAKSACHRSTIVALFASLLLASASFAERWSVVPGEPQKAGFHSKAPMESFDGTTDRVNGFIELDESAVGDSIAIEVRVDMATLDTGIAMRNRHMRENHLHTDRFPEAVFRGGRVVSGAGADLRDGGTRAVEVEGVLDLHGVNREVTIVLHMTRTDAEGAAGLRITAEFPVSLADHEIPRPRFLFAKLGEVQKAYVDLLASPDSTAAEASSPFSGS